MRLHFPQAQPCLVCCCLVHLSVAYYCFQFCYVFREVKTEGARDHRDTVNCLAFRKSFNMICNDLTGRTRRSRPIHHQFIYFAVSVPIVKVYMSFCCLMTGLWLWWLDTRSGRQKFTRLSYCQKTVLPRIHSGVESPLWNKFLKYRRQAHQSPCDVMWRL